MRLQSLLSSIENEGIPEEQSRGPSKYIEKVGTQFCIRSNGIDQNFGCWPSKEKAQAVMAGKSFIEPDLPKNLLAGKVTRMSPSEFRRAERKAGIKPCIKSSKVRSVHKDYIKRSEWEVKDSGKITAPSHLLAGGPGSGRYAVVARFGSDIKSKELTKEDAKQLSLKLKEEAKAYNKKFGGRIVMKSPTLFDTVEHPVGASSDTIKQLHRNTHWPGMYAGGPGSGRKKEAMKEYQRMYQLAKQAGLNDKKATQVAKDAYIEKFQRMYAGGVGSGRKPSLAKGPNKWKSRDEELKDARNDPKQIKLPLKAVGPPMISFKTPSPYKKSEMSGPKPAKVPSSVGHRKPNPQFKANKIQAHDWGEPNAGAYQHAHLDSNLFFHPPSLKNPTRIPTDDPGEKDNKFGDVSKRKAKSTDIQRMKMLKRSAPGGSPPAVPVRTTLVSPTLNSYMPLMASAHRQRRRSGGGNYRAYGAASI